MRWGSTVGSHLREREAAGRKLHVIFCTNDEMALGAADALLLSGIRWTADPVRMLREEARRGLSRVTELTELDDYPLDIGMARPVLLLEDRDGLAEQGVSGRAIPAQWVPLTGEQLSAHQE
jgi:hypothetical protein